MLEATSWTANFQAAFKNSSELSQFLGWNLPNSVDEKFSLFVPRRLAKRIKAQGPDGVLARQFLPRTEELSDAGLADPIGDRANSKAPQLIHRYKSRALFTPTSVCPVHCRYCFRKNELSPTDELFQSDFLETINYLQSHPEISELIFTGGDPLTLSNEKLEKYLEAFALIPSLKDIRFHTRYPVILPERLDADLLILLDKFAARFRTVSLVIHVNHRDELDDEAKARIKLLSSINVQVLSQSVLLKGVNDSVSELKNLIEELMNLKVRPYYLHHPDQVKGGMHFYLPVEEGRRIYGALRDLVPGWALPQYVLDIPGGAGKVGAFNPEGISFSGNLLGRDLSLYLVSEPE